MLNCENIIKLSDKYLVGAPTQRVPERIQTLEDIELETKINIEVIQDVKNILDKIKSIGISKASRRREWHHFFSNNLVAHSVLILVENSNEVWIKIKKDKNEVYTPNKKLPLLSRHERKIKPQDRGYREEFQKTIIQRYIGSFKKECIDLSFYYKDLSFTATLSLADSEDSSLYQIEFEYDGHKEDYDPPTYEAILNTFEQMLSDICGSKIKRLTTHTKLSWLLNEKAVIFEKNV